jgi:uncharacterized protein YkwD
MNSFARCCVVWLSLGTCVILAQAQPTRASQPANSGAIQAEAWRIVQLANQSRAAAGAGPLKWDPELAAAARQHCLRMAQEGPISHRYRGEPEPAERAAQAGAHFSLFEENVALGPDPATIHQQWMHSPGHRTNLLNPSVDRVGVAVVAGRRGLYAVADYARNVPVLTQAQVETRVAGMVQSGGVEIQRDAKAAREACKTDDGIPGSNTGGRIRFIMRWQDADLSRLPSELTSELSSGKFRRAEVASCTPQGEQGWFTAYRIAVLLY